MITKRQWANIKAGDVLVSCKSGLYRPVLEGPSRPNGAVRLRKVASGGKFPDNPHVVYFWNDLKHHYRVVKKRRAAPARR